MMPTFRWLFLVYVLWCCIPVASADHWPDESPMTRNGPLRKAAPIVLQLLDGQLVDQVLQVSRVDSPYETESFLDSTDGSVGSGGFSYSRDKEWQLSYGNSQVWLRIRQRVVRPSALWQDWTIEERITPNRRVMLSAGPNGELHIEMTSNQLGYLLRFYQSDAGHCLVQELSGSGVISLEAKSFLDLCKGHHVFVGQRLLPALSAAGIGQVKTEYHFQVVEAVRLHFRPLAMDELASLQELVDGLDSPVFADRQQASKKVATLWKRDQTSLLRLLAHQDLSPESKRRIRSAISESSTTGSEWLTAFDFLEAEELLQQPEYLQWLLQSETDEAVRESMMQRLQDLPSVNSQEEVTEAAPTTGDSANASLGTEVVAPSRDPGGLARLAKPMSRLVHIVGRDGRLTLDQQHWARQFGGKTIRQLVKETEDFIRDQQLPGEWFQPERENELALDYPPVIFRSIKDDLRSDVISEAQWQQWSHETNSSGWTDTITSRRNRLTLDWGFDSKPSLFGNLFPSNSKSFRLSVEEFIAPRRELVVETSVDGRLLIRVGSRHDQWVIQVVQFPDGTLVVQDVRGMESRSLRVESFNELSTLHGEYLAGELLPVLRAVGIELH